MKKLLQKLVLVVMVFGLIGQTALAEGFSDLNTSHPNYNAVIYLQNAGILNGYSDGTFKPDRSVNRAEFLKIILEGSDISTSGALPAPFPDVDQNAWYGSYVNKAFNEGWITGYPDGTFGPEKTINKAEALKILSKAQDWDIATELNSKPFTDVATTDWFATYAAFAKENNYIESSNGLFVGSTLMTRGSISQIIFNTLTIEESVEVSNTTEDTETTVAENTNSETNEEIEEQTPLDFNPVSSGTIKTIFYSGITLLEELPTIYYKNEVYIIEGDVKDSSYSSATVIIDSEDGSVHESFSASTTGTRFAIPVHFRNSGNYQIGIIPGDSGKSKAVEISVMPSLPTATITTPTTEAEDLAMTFIQDQTAAEFSSPSSTIKKLVIAQGGKSVTYYSRQDKGYIPLEYENFYNFDEGKTSYYIETAHLQEDKPLVIDSDFVRSETETFTASEHTFDYIEEEDISATAPDILTNISTINVTGKLKTDGKIDVLITKPDGFVETSQLTSNAQPGTYFGQKIIPAGNEFSFSYKPQTKGRYIVEINNKNSEPIFNHPVYVGDAVPLIPDFFDLNKRKFFKGTLNVEEARQELLDLINEERENHGLNSLVLSDELNTLAQAHSQDMKNKNFFGHYNKENETPNDRRLALGIKTPVGENIAKDVGIEFGHYGLMRSGSHRKNLLTKDWTRVGLGVVEDGGYLLITEEFSTFEPTSENLINYKNELLEAVNDKRDSEGKDELIYFSAIENAAESLNDKIIDEETTINNSDFTQALNQNNIDGNSQLIGRNSGSWQSILDSILDDEENIFQSMWELIGLDIQIDQTGNLNTIVIINDGD